MAYMDNPYFLPAQQEQQIGGIPPMMQNIAAQQAAQQAALAQGQQMSQQAGQAAGASQGAAALAAALRKGPKDSDPNAKSAAMGGIGSYNPLKQLEITSKYGTDPYSQQSRMLAAQEEGF